VISIHYTASISTAASFAADLRLRQMAIKDAGPTRSAEFAARSDIEAWLLGSMLLDHLADDGGINQIYP
jgi:hypothetical protein